MMQTIVLKHLCSVIKDSGRKFAPPSHWKSLSKPKPQYGLSIDIPLVCYQAEGSVYRPVVQFQPAERGD